MAESPRYISETCPCGDSIAVDMTPRSRGVISPLLRPTDRGLLLREWREMHAHHQERTP